MDTFVRTSPSVQKSARRRRTARQRQRHAPPHPCNTNQERNSPPGSAADGPRQLHAEDEAWLHSLQSWARRFIEGLGVLKADVEDVFIHAFGRVISFWESFVPDPELPERSARRRWIAGHLLTEACRPRPDGVRLILEQRLERPATLGPVPPVHLAGAGEALRALQASTLPQRWRAWVACEVDGVRVAEVARQEGQPPATIHARMRRAREDFGAVLRRVLPVEPARQRRGKRRRRRGA